MGVCSNGYGKAWDRVLGQNALAHRAAWEAVHGSIPPGMHVHHRCKNRLCVNVEHLELLTPKEHRAEQMKPTCPYGHLYTRTTTRQRVCQTCRREQQRRRRVDKRINQPGGTA